MNRPDVFQLIDRERQYHEQLLARKTHQAQVPDIGHEIATLEEILLRARAAWYDRNNLGAMEMVRKLAGVAVRAIEHHPTPERMLLP